MYYTRKRHGRHPVSRISGGGYRLVHPDGSTTDYRNARRLLMAIHGGRDPRMSFDRYFRVGKHAVCRRTRPVLRLGVLTRRSRMLGIDLARHSDDVRRLFGKACGRAVKANGYEFEDVLQDVYKGILVRNRGAGAFNPRRSSLGSYVVMVSHCMFSNYHRREQRRSGRERAGIPAFRDGSWVEVDASEAAVCVESSEQGRAELAECITDLADYIVEQPRSYRQDASLYQDAAIARTVLPLVSQGKRRGEIAAELALPQSAVSNALAYLRSTARTWV